jgi:hypothetical protein
MRASRRPLPPRGQSWHTFLHNHTAYCPESCRGVSSHDLRRFLYFFVTRGWDTEGQEGTRGDSLDTVIVDVMPLEAAWAWSAYPCFTAKVSAPLEDLVYFTDCGSGPPPVHVHGLMITGELKPLPSMLVR